MTEQCPNCKAELAVDDSFCGNCGWQRPNAKVPAKLPTVALRAAPGAPRLVGENAEPVQEIAPVQEQPAPEPSPVAQALAATEEVPIVSEPALEPWKCVQCNAMNAGQAEYCDTCGAMRVASVREKVELAADSQPTLPYPIAPIKVVEGTGTRPGWRFRNGSGTNEGMSRRGKANEDSVFTLELQRYFEAKPESFGFYIVADGMGGQAAGEVASRIAIQNLSLIALHELVAPWLGGQVLAKDVVGEIMKRAVKEAHARIRQFNADSGSDSGTTVTMACIIDNQLVCANSGDSRTYLWRANPEPVEEPPPAEAGLGTAKTVKLNKSDRDKIKVEVLEDSPYKIEKVSRDQSLVQDLVDSGVITAEQAYSDPRRNVVLSALGSPEENILIDVYYRELKTGDRVVLVSDGLWEMVRDGVTAEQIAKATDLNATAEQLIEMACQNGGVDNVSVVIVEATYK